jgi:hypothetical protein
MIEFQMKYIHFVIDSKRLMDQPFSADLVSIEWIESTDSGDDSRGTDYRAGTNFLEDKKVMVASRLFDPPIKGAKRLVNPIFQGGVLRRQSGQSVLDYAGQMPETGKIVISGWA